MFNTKSPLKNLAEFERILKNYRPSLELLDLLHGNKLVVVAGPSASGRNTLINSLIMTGKYTFLVSDTTRLPRINNGVPETNGKEYWFKNEEEFLHGLKNTAYVEAAIIHNQQVSGISLNELRKAYISRTIGITDVDIQGCDSIKSLSDSAVPIFVLPPDFAEWMQRLDHRGVMGPDEKRRRLISAAQEIELALNRSYFKFIVNYDLRYTAEQLHDHIINDNFGDKEQSNAHKHAKQLLLDLSQNTR
jgi:guanylate kinase